LKNPVSSCLSFTPRFEVIAMVAPFGPSSYSGFQLRVQERGAYGVRRVLAALLSQNEKRRGLILLANSNMSDKLMVFEN
jgi:hypothetical protein